MSRTSRVETRLPMNSSPVVRPAAFSALSHDSRVSRPRGVPPPSFSLVQHVASSLCCESQHNVRPVSAKYEITVNSLTSISSHCEKIRGLEYLAWRLLVQCALLGEQGETRRDTQPSEPQLTRRGKEANNFASFAEECRISNGKTCRSEKVALSLIGPR